MAKKKRKADDHLENAKTGADKLQRQLEEEKRKRKLAEAQAKTNADMIARLDAQVDAVNRAKFNFAPSKIRPSKGALVRVIIPDTHGAKADTGAVKVFLSDLAVLQPKHIIMLGDHVDCDGFLSLHHTPGYVAQTNYTYEDDIAAANTLLDKIRKCAPGARIEYLEGNHEQRVEKWCVTQAHRNSADAEFLRKRLAPEYLLHLEERGIPYYRRDRKYDGLSVPGVIKRGHCYFTHGSRTNKHATALMLEDIGSNVVFGHIHRVQNFAKRTVHHGSLSAWCPGCLCVLQKYWQHTQVSQWNHGYAVQLVKPDGDFLHINIPIIDDKSYLIAFAERLK